MWTTGTSALAETEIGRTVDTHRRQQMLAVLETLVLVPIPATAHDLANEYIAGRIFSPRQIEDALHVAAAVTSGIGILVSWNFRHLVNLRRRGMVLAINARLDYPVVEIVSPPEV